MNVTVVLEHRFTRTPDGAVWTEGPFGYSFFTRYLAEFDSVRVAARVLDVEQVQPGSTRCDGQGVSFHALPHYIGPWGYVSRWAEFRWAASKVAGSAGAIILRVPSQAAICVERALRRSGRPYGLEAVGDPHQAFAPGAHRSFLRLLARRHHFRRLRDQCSAACAVAYVTAGALQRKYPAAGFTTHYSSVELPEDALVANPRSYERRGVHRRLITVGSLEHFYKGQDILIQAVAQCIGRGLELELVLIGEGRRRPELEAMADRLGLAGRVRFRGQVPAGHAVRAELDKADLFVLPSRQEGLPRAMVEAMARALPCVGSTAGGIPELLPSEDCMPAGDSKLLAAKLAEILGDPGRLQSMSARNIEKAWEYTERVLRPRRDRFYRHVRRQTERWLRNNPARTGSSSRLPCSRVQYPRDASVRSFLFCARLLDR